MGIFYPNVCPFCGSEDSKWCVYENKVGNAGTIGHCIANDCSRIQPYLIQEPRCMRCGKPLRYQEREFCVDCEEKSFSYDQGKTAWIHKGAISCSIYDFKFHNKRIYGKIYAEELVYRYRHIIDMWRPDVLVPVPLHPRRQRKRGYNQAEILAEYISQEIQVPVAEKAVIRRRYTRPQKILDHRDRQKNLHHAFKANYQYLTGVERVLIVDDIYTTGATIDEMAKTLKKTGVKKVYFLAISIGQGF